MYHVRQNLNPKITISGQQCWRPIISVIQSRTRSSNSRKRCRSDDLGQPASEIDRQSCKGVSKVTENMS